MSNDSVSKTPYPLYQYDMRVLNEVRQRQPEAYGPEVVKALVAHSKKTPTVAAWRAARALLRLERQGLVVVVAEEPAQQAQRLDNREASVWQSQQRMLYKLTPEGEHNAGRLAAQPPHDKGGP